MKGQIKACRKAKINTFGRTLCRLRTREATCPIPPEGWLGRASQGRC